MIKCKKCGTENKDSNKTCKKCGVNLKSNKIFYIAGGIIIIFIVIFVVFQKTNSDEIVIVPPSENNNEEENNTLNKEPLPSANTNFNKSKAEVEKDIVTILEASNAYLDYYNDYTSFVTRNGFLFDHVSKNYISLDYLNDSENVNDIFTNNEALILYLKPQDVSAVIEKNINSNNILELFIAYETKDSFLITSKNLEKTYITKEQYKEILDIYKLEDSFVELVGSSNPEYEKLIDALKEFTSYEGFDIRYMFKDDRYSFAVVSPYKQFDKIKAFILEKENDKWEVKVDKIETFLKPNTEINKVVTNFDLNKLPSYNLSQYKDIMINDYDGVVELLKSEKHIDDSDGEVTFFSATDDFAYLEFSEGKKFLARITEEDVWVLYPIQSYEEARIIMVSIKEEAPFFILKQS